jgi:predicted hydrocarbon binding protein
LQASSPRKAAGYDLRRLVGSVNQLRFNDNRGEVSFFGQKMIILRRDVIRIMREALERLVGDQSGPFLSYLASGIGVHEGSIFRESIGTTGPETRPQLENLVHSALEDTNLGLGKVRINTIDFDKTNADITIANCFEATENGPSEEPNCIFTSGFLAGIFAEVLDKTVQAKEIKCISKGAPECEFHISLAETNDGEAVEKPNVDMKQVDTAEAAKAEVKPGTSGGSIDSKSAIGASKGTSDNEVDLSDAAKMDAGAEKAARIAKHKQHFWNKMKKS